MDTERLGIRDGTQSEKLCFRVLHFHECGCRVPCRWAVVFFFFLHNFMLSYAVPYASMQDWMRLYDVPLGSCTWTMDTAWSVWLLTTTTPWSWHGFILQGQIKPGQIYKWVVEISLIRQGSTISIRVFYTPGYRAEDSGVGRAEYPTYCDIRVHTSCPNVPDEQSGWIPKYINCGNL